MTARSAAESTLGSALVPLAERMRGLLVLRAALAVAVLLVGAVLPGMRGLGYESLLVVTATYLAMTLLAGQLWRLHRRIAIDALGWTLVLDGAWLAVSTYGAFGLGQPLQYLVLLHLIGVTLLVSFRTGIKVAVWHTILIMTVEEMQRTRLISGRPVDFADLLVFLSIAWLLTTATASFAAVNERELRRRNVDLQGLARLAWSLESAIEPTEVAGGLTKAVAEDFSMRRVIMLAAETGELAVLASEGPVELPRDSSPSADRLISEAMQQRTSLRVSRLDPEQEPWLAEALPDALNVMVFPLYAEGSPLGVLVAEMGRRRGARIERRVVTMVERFVSQTSLALANAWLLQRVRRMATTDALTGVPNRRSFDDVMIREISRAERRQDMLCVALVDIDHFKKINDTYGHQTGDVTLQRVAAALTGAVRTGDVVARYGGEEFAIVLPNADLETARKVAERARLAVSAIAEDPRVTASLGLASFPQHGLAPVEMLARADAALYEAKADGRNCLKLARSAEDQAALDALAALDGALEPGAGTDAEPVPEDELGEDSVEVSEERTVPRQLRPSGTP